MINKRDVLRIRMPFPNISSQLALQAHMFICHEVSGNKYGFVKCQTLKPYMLTRTLMKHYWDEVPDINRNPFKQTTRIDCDKDFITENIIYDDAMKTTIRPDICVDAMDHIDAELIEDGYASHAMDESEVLSLNSLTQKIKP